MNEYLARVPYDLYELSLFHLVVKHGSFTKAAALAGLTQSAITRQIKGVENNLGITLLERTTRSVRVTDAGAFLYQESSRLLGDVDQSLRRLNEDFAGAKKEIRIGISRSISPAYLPGFFHANIRARLEVNYRMVCRTSVEILTDLEANELDLAILCPPPRLPPTIKVTHRFADGFTFIAGREQSASYAALPKNKSARIAWLQGQTWLGLETKTNTGKYLKQWLARQGLNPNLAMQLDSFDLIINLVSLGLGIGLVPVRTLALYGQKKNLARLAYPRMFSRELVVVMRRHRTPSPHLKAFVDHILF